MSKKLFSLVPLLAIVAFALAPAVSQAAEIPHWYKNGTRQAEGKPVFTVTFGETKNLAQNSPAGEINCKGVGAGSVENPKGTAPNTGASGPAGVGITTLSDFTECVAPKCEAEVKAAGLPAGFVGRGNVLTNNFPWSNSLRVATKTDPNGYPFEEVIGAPSNLSKGAKPKLGEEFSEGYPAETKAASGTGAAWGAPGAIGAMIVCEIYPNPEGLLGAGEPKRVAGELAFEGELSPFIGGSLNEGPPAKPAKAEFEGANTGGLESIAGDGTNTGGVKYLGYNIQEGLTVLPN